MRQYSSLSSHNAECNEFFYRYQDCQYEHPVRKFLGFCNDLEKEMRACMKQQRKINRNKNYELSKQRTAKLREVLAKQAHVDESM